MITDEEQIEHARTHTDHVVGHVGAAKEHLDNAMRRAGLSKSATAGHHLAKLGLELGSSLSQHAQGKKHIDSLIGRKGWDGSSDFALARSNSNRLGSHLKQAAEHYSEMADMQHDPEAMSASHEKLKEHLDKAEECAGVASDAIGRALEARGVTPTEHSPQKKNKADDATTLIKGVLSMADDGKFQLYIPFSKIDEQKDGSLIVEACASVSDYVDSQGDYFTPDALEKAMGGWAVTGNIRLQHDSKKPVGTIKPPVLGKMDDSALLGWWMADHPVTKTPAAFVRAHIVADEAIRLTKSGVLTGLSVGGEILAGGFEMVDVEIDDKTGAVIREVAA